MLIAVRGGPDEFIVPPRHHRLPLTELRVWRGILRWEGATKMRTQFKEFGRPTNGIRFGVTFDLCLPLFCCVTRHTNHVTFAGLGQRHRTAQSGGIALLCDLCVQPNDI